MWEAGLLERQTEFKWAGQHHKRILLAQLQASTQFKVIPSNVRMRRPGDKALANRSVTAKEPYGPEPVRAIVTKFQVTSFTVVV